MAEAAVVHATPLMANGGGRWRAVTERTEQMQKSNHIACRQTSLHLTATQTQPERNEITVPKAAAHRPGIVSQHARFMEGVQVAANPTRTQ